MARTKEVVFDLTLPAEQIELDLRLMQARGYVVDNIKFCFEELEKNGYGVYKKGTLGRGNVSKFIPNITCPKEYKIDFILKSTGRTKKLIEKEEK